MSYTQSTPIRERNDRNDLAAQRVHRFMTYAQQNGAKRLDDLREYVELVHTIAPSVDLNPDVVLGQWHLETDGGKSDAWAITLNPAGIGVTNDSERTKYQLETGTRAALTHLVHLSLYVHGTRLSPILAPSQLLDYRWQAAIDAGYAGKASTLDDLTGRWAADDQYGFKIASRMTMLANIGAIPDAQLVDPEEPDQPAGSNLMLRSEVAVLLVEGHRSIGDRGSPVERELTDDLARAYEPAFKSKGYKVVRVNPTLTPGGLDGLGSATARAIQAAINAGAKLVLMLDLHFNTSTSPVHAIVAHNRRQDGRGTLSTAIPAGRVAGDLASNNSLDVSLAKAIAAEISSIAGMRNRTNTNGYGAGVMLENESGVGGQGYRLAMMAYTAPYLAKCVRITIEHGGTNDASKPRFFELCAAASLKAVETVLAPRFTDTLPNPDDGDDDLPPEGDAGEGALLVALFGEADGFQYDPQGPVSAMWRARFAETGKAARLVETFTSATALYFQFSDGSIIVRNDGEAARWLTTDDAKAVVE